MSELLIALNFIIATVVGDNVHVLYMAKFISSH